MFSSFDFSKLAAHRIEMEFHNQGILIDLVKDKESTEYIYFDSSQLGDCYEYKENTK